MDWDTTSYRPVGGLPLPRAIMEKAVASPSTTGFEREHKHSQYREIGPRRASIELWRRGKPTVSCMPQTG